MKRVVERLTKKCKISDEEIQKYQAWADKVQKMLQEDTDWVNQYEEYATDIIDKGTPIIEQCRKKFNVPDPLACYLTLGNIKNGNPVFDLRYLGQSVGEIRINKDKPILVVSKKKAESSDEFFEYKIGPCNEPWATGAKAKDFRDFFKDRVGKFKFPRQKEHMVEARLFQELAKTSGADKQLKYIQPIKFANCFTHMKTALSASEARKSKVAVVKRGGGEIDVFCRRKSGNESRLTVIEVKDKPERNESFKEAMFQAIAYAVFIRELIHTPHGNKWMEIWGINNKKTSGITINAVVAIPVGDEEIPDFCGQGIKLGNDTIELHYMALGKDVLETDGTVYFETSLKI